MNSARITAEAVIVGKDETGGAFASVSRKMQDMAQKMALVGKAANISAQVERTTAALRQQEAALAAIGKVRAAEQRWEGLNRGAAAAKVKVDQVSQAYAAMAKAEGLASKEAILLKAKLDQAEASAARSRASLYRQGETLQQLRSAAQGSGVSIGNLASEENRLKHGVDSANSALIRQHQLLRQSAAAEEKLTHQRHFARETGHHLATGALGVAGGLGGAYIAARGIEHVVHAGAEVEAGLNKIRNVSGGEAEVDLAREISGRASGAYPYTTRAQSIEDYVELRSLAVSEKHGEPINREAIERNVMLMARARAALASSGYALEKGEGKALAQAIEGSGRTLDPRAQEKMLDAYVRGKQVFGNAIQASSVRDFVANAKATNFSASDESFFFTTMARLAQGNASRLGNEFSQTINTIVGGHMTKQGAEWLASVGMINPNQIRKGGGGKFYIAGKIKDQDLLSTDQTAWAQQVLMPGIQSKAVLNEKNVAARVQMLRTQELRANPNAVLDDRTQHERATHGLIADFVSKSGFRTTVTDNFVHAIANAYQTQKDVEQMKTATGMGAERNLGKDPIAAFEELKNSVTSFVSVLSGPMTGKAGEAMHSMAGGVAHLSDALGQWQKEHPDLAMGATAAAGIGGGAIAAGGAYLGYQWLTAGVQLNTAATALTGSAAELSAAAVRLAGGSSLPGGPATAAAGGAAAAGGGFLASVGRMLPWLGIGYLAGEEIKAHPDLYPHLQSDYMPAKFRHLGEVSDEEFTRQRLNDRLEYQKQLDYRPSSSSAGAGPGTLAILSDREAEDRQTVLRTGGALTGHLPAFRGDIDEIVRARGDDYGLRPGGALTGSRSDAFGGVDIGGSIHSALEGLKATVEQPVPVDVSGKLEPVELKGEGQVHVTVKVDGAGKVTDTFTSSSGHIRTSVGTSSPDAKLNPPT